VYLSELRITITPREYRQHLKHLADESGSS
jgi:hypothetical protein